MLPAHSSTAKHAASNLYAFAAASGSLSALRAEHGWYLSSIRSLSASTSTWLAESAAAVIPPKEGVVSGETLQVSEPSARLTYQHVGNYFSIDKKKIPEAFPELHNLFYAPRDKGQQRRGGCTGLQAELSSTGSSSIMYRQSVRDLIEAVKQGAPGSRFLVQGLPGSGKSIALASLVEWARSTGWLVMYVPSAAALTMGGYFTPRVETGRYDTLISAQHILKGMQDAHGDQLSKMPCTLKHPGSSIEADKPSAKEAVLTDLITKGLSTDINARLAVDCCLALKNELVAAAASKEGSQCEVLFAVDDYNCLHWHTEYGTTSKETGLRVPLQVEDLTLASELRLLLVDGLGSAKAVGALTGSRGVNPKMNIPVAAGCKTHTMPRYNKVEVAHALYHYYTCGNAPSPATLQQVVEMEAYTQGNGSELRKLACRMSLVKIGAMMK